MKKGEKMSEEQKIKSRISNLGQKRSVEARLKMSISQKGKRLGYRHSELVKSKIAKSLTGRKRPPFSKEVLQKMSEAQIGKKRSIEMRKKMSILTSGSKNHFWKGGISGINERIRKSLEYKLWRTAVFERDNYTCIWGGKEHGSKLNADHIKSFAQYPELRFAIDNGRTLCVDCHRKTDNYGSKAIRK